MKTCVSYLRKSETLIVLCLICATLLVGCNGNSFLKPVQVTKDTAEETLYQARVMQNKGLITEVQFDTMRKVYDSIKVAQDTVIDARIAYLKDGTATKKAILDAAVSAVASRIASYSELAVRFGIIGGGK